MKTFKAYKKNHTSHRHLTNAFESLREQQQQQEQPYILTDAMNAEIYTQSTSREIMVNLGIVNDTEANQSKLIHRQLTKTATNILPLMMPSSSPSLLSSLLLPSSSSSSSEAVALTKSALSALGESNKLKEMPRNQRCHLKNTDKQMFTMNPALLSTDISCQKTNSTPPSSLTLSSLPAPSPLTITSFAYDEVDLVRATATSKALASTTTSATTNSSSYYNTVSLLSSFLTSFSTFSKRKKPNAAFFFTHRHLASNSKTAVTWLLSLLCLVALFGCGHAGFACLSNPCVFGVCIDGLNSSYSCYCIDGYTGIQCQTNWDECWSGPCQNGGTCIDGVAYYNCTCPDGFSGTDCEENVDECMSNPCQNGGHCRDRNNGYTCTCQPGYLGDHCEIDVAVCETGTGARCHNGGECIEGPGLEFSCECAPGWHGRICQDEINECDSAPCQNGGVCVDKLASYVCACPMGYTGTNCEEEILICADNPCQNNALCLMEEGVPTCYCVPDYHGEKCEFQYDECQLGPRCMNGGVCIDGVDTFSCSCPPLLTGMLCECLMIGEDSLDCNYTAPSTQATPVYSKPKYMPTTPVTAIYSKPKYLPTTPAFPMYTKPKWVSEITTAKTYVTTMFLGEDDISSEIAKSSEQGASADGESLEKPITTGQSSEETISSTKKTYIPSPGWGGDISPVITEPPGSYQSGSKDSSEVTHSSEVSGSVEITGSDEFTTIARFDESSESAEITTVKPVSISGDLDYTSGSKSGEFLPGSKEYPGKEALDVFEQPPTKTSYVPSVITTSIDTTYRGIDYSKPTRPSWVAPPTYYPTLTTSHATSKPESDSHFSTTYFTTIEEHSGVGPTKTIPIIRPGMPTTTTAPFFTDYPEVVITTKYYDFGHKEKDKEIGITPRPHIPTYSVTTIGTVHDYEGPAITTAAPGISITVYSPENRTYPHHYTTPYQPLTTTTSTVKTYHETTTPYYHPSPTLTAGTIKPGYHSEIAVTTASPQHLYTEDLITQRIPASIPEVGISAKPDFPEIATEYHHTVVTYGPPATYKPTMRPTSPSLTKMPTILPPKPTLLPQPTSPPTTPPTPVTLAPQPALPAQPTLLPPPATLLPPQPTYPPPVYSTHQTVSVKIPTAVGEVASEEEDSANTVSPLIPGGGGIGGVSHTGGAGPIDADSQADCIKMGCYNGGTCVTTSEGSRCVCRFDRQGALCETPIIIKNAAFSGDSYVSHRIHKDIQHHDSLDTVLPMHVQLKVRTRATNGLIMLAAAQGTKGGHYMALFLQKGLLQFQFSCGLQTMLLSELETPVNTGHEITIRAELDFSRNYTHCNASLLVNDTLAMSGDQPTWLKLLPSRMHSPEAILNTWLHLGGAPQAPIGLIIELPPSQSGSGFTGCLHSLRINEETREIFGEALDGFGITECGSLACLSSPCRNGAACIKIETNEVDENGDKVEKWKCKCPTGYMGPTCEVSVCEDNPCQYGGTCVQFPGSGYLCLCPLGKHGHYCEHNLEVALPSFSGSVNGLSSFVAYTVPIPLEYSLELSFKILPQTMSQIALLAFLGQTGYHDEKSDHLAISFIQGYIMLTWNLGAGPRRIFTQKPIDFRLDAPRVPYEIKVGRIGRQAWLSVDGKFNITGRSPGSVSRMDVMPILYLGGHEIANFHTLPHDLPLHSGFQGCIYDVHLKAGQVTVPLQETRGVRGRGVGQCGTRECHRHACQHDGACLQHGATFTCICQEGWYGPLCAQPTNPCDSFNNKCSDDSTCVPLVNGYECDCPVGKTGKNCEEAIHSLSDVSLTGRRSYLAVRWPYFYENSDKLGSKRSQMISYRNFTKKLMPPKPISSANQHFVMKLLNEVEKQRSFSPVPLKTYEEHHRVQFFFIEFQLRPLSERGLLLYFGTLNNNQDKKIGFVSLSLQGGVVEFRISGPNSHVTVVRSVRMLAIGEWHKIKMAQRGRWLTLWVEGSASSALAPTAEVLVEPDSLLYIGGLKDLSKLPHNAISGFPIPFRGCVRGLVVSGSRIVLNETNIMESRNIRDCDGTACGGDSCEAGGHCWLDEKLQPHCICPEYAKGNRCEYSETCKLIPCKNNGRCLRSGRCSCPNGWGGFYCEIALGKPTTPSFRGNSYLVLPPQRIPMKDKRKGPSLYIRPREALQISLNFSTIEPDGLLLWSEHDNTKFLGLGLEDGHLKLASNLLGSINDTVSAPSSGFIADGSWHTAKIIVDRGLLELQLDGEVVFSEKLALAESLMPSSTTTSTTPSPYRTRTRSSLALRRGKQPTITYENTFYLGGFPNLDPVNKRTQGRFELPFKGCLQDIQFGAEPNTLIKDFSTYQGENIGSCDLHGDEPIVV